MISGLAHDSRLFTETWPSAVLPFKGSHSQYHKAFRFSSQKFCFVENWSSPFSTSALVQRRDGQYDRQLSAKNPNRYSSPFPRSWQPQPRLKSGLSTSLESTTHGDLGLVIQDLHLRKVRSVRASESENAMKMADINVGEVYATSDSRWARKIHVTEVGVIDRKSGRKTLVKGRMEDRRFWTDIDGVITISGRTLVRTWAEHERVMAARKAQRILRNAEAREARDKRATELFEPFGIGIQSVWSDRITVTMTLDQATQVAHAMAQAVKP